MAGKIQARYDELDDVANHFAQEAAEVEQMQQRVRSAIANLQDGGWIGDAADAFYAEMEDEVLPAVQRLAEALEEANSTVKKISTILSNAEQEAAAIVSRET
ncbi:MAG: WXG100 family type VII secretion target [Anaerolineae bacterium]|nr:WXG100 family type VII secretion target [Anaerolineae bacterium]